MQRAFEDICPEQSAVLSAEFLKDLWRRIDAQMTVTHERIHNAVEDVRLESIELPLPSYIFYSIIFYSSIHSIIHSLIYLFMGGV